MRWHITLQMPSHWPSYSPPDSTVASWCPATGVTLIAECAEAILTTIPDSIHAGNRTDWRGIVRLPSVAAIVRLLPGCLFLSPNLNQPQLPPHSPSPPTDEPSAVCERVSFPSLLCVTGCGRSADDEVMEMLGGHGHCDAGWLLLWKRHLPKKGQLLGDGSPGPCLPPSCHPHTHQPTHTLTHTHPQSHTLHAHAFIVSLKMLIDPFVNWVDFIGSVLQSIHQVFCFDSKLLNVKIDFYLYITIGPVSFWVLLLNDGCQENI